MALNQKERDWLQWLHQAKRKQITQREAAQRMQVSERWVRRLLQRMKREKEVAQRVQTADFFGASSVASALDVARRRGPADNDLTLSPSLPPPSQNRNFLLCTK
jgi:DNA-binding transcriptional regulator LsrR (DeoR family)